VSARAHLPGASPRSPRALVVSFGYLHAPAPTAHVTLDLRTLLRDPHVSPEMRELTGLDPAVQASVMRQPGAENLLHVTAAVALTLGHQLASGQHTATVAIGCAGGRHRSVVIAAELANALAESGFDVTLWHRDLARPVVDRSTGEA
jgi:RNase adaptor protein for sRNA GlmZ degradation